MTVRKALKSYLFRAHPGVAARAAEAWDELSTLGARKLSMRQALRYLWFGMCPLVARRFTYYGTKVYFPRASVTFRRACEEGVYEPDVTPWLCRLAQAGTTFLD